ncbi:MAG: hypothetical protein V5A46_06520 [Haloferacaceae archaeon]
MPEDNAVPVEGETETTRERPGLSVRRRGVLAGTAGFASVALAGCAGEEEPTEAPTAEPTEEPTEEPTDTPEPQPENYVVTDTVLVGSDYVPEGTGGFASSCAPSRRFVPEMTVVFHIGVWDPETGDAVGDDTVDSATVELDGFDATVELGFDADAGYWSGSWSIPADAEPQTVSFTIAIENSGEYRRVGDLDTQFEIIELQQDPTANFVVTAQTYNTSTLGDAGSESSFVQSCSPNNTFDPTAEVGFDIGIWHADSGEMVTPDDGAVDSAQIVFPEYDQELELSWGPDATDSWEEGDHGYQGVWRNIPEDVAGQSVTYEVQVTGSTGDEEFNQVGIYRNSLTFVES